VIFEEQNINSIYPESEFLIALHAAFAQSAGASASPSKTAKSPSSTKPCWAMKKGPTGIL